MRRLIADAGSTKVAWTLIGDDGAQLDASTPGVNPAVMDAEQILGILSSGLQGVIAAMPDVIHYYGAGCKGEGPIGRMQTALRDLFPACQRIEIQSDMLGAARALLADKSGVACILGTGANSCYYDGQTITANTPAGGYILGDEFSGAWIGKTLISDYLKRYMPNDLRQQFEHTYGLTEAGIIEAVYRPQPGAMAPNRFLASFAPFASENRQQPYIEELLTVGAQLFVERNVLLTLAAAGISVKDAPQVGFIGSVACSFRNYLTSALNEHGLFSGNFLTSPLIELIQYHRR